MARRKSSTTSSSKSAPKSSADDGAKAEAERKVAEDVQDEDTGSASKSKSTTDVTTVDEAETESAFPTGDVDLDSVPTPSTPGLKSHAVGALQDTLTNLGFDVSADVKQHYGNATRNAVAKLQRKLAEAGAYNGPANGAYTRQTARALAVAYPTDS